MYVYIYIYMYIYIYVYSTVNMLYSTADIHTYTPIV